MTMLRSFLLTFDPTYVTRQQVLNVLDTRSEIKHWYALFPASVLVTSPHSAHEVAAIIHSSFPLLQFLVTEVLATQANGWLSKAAWDFITHPTSSGRWPATPSHSPRPAGQGDPETHIDALSEDVKKTTGAGTHSHGKLK